MEFAEAGGARGVLHGNIVHVVGVDEIERGIQPLVAVRLLAGLRILREEIPADVPAPDQHEELDQVGVDHGNTKWLGAVGICVDDLLHQAVSLTVKLNVCLLRLKTFKKLSCSRETGRGEQRLGLGRADQHRLAEHRQKRRKILKRADRREVEQEDHPLSVRGSLQ